MGLLVGMALYPIISPSARHRTIVIVLRVLALPLIIVLYVVLIRNFYTTDPNAGEYLVPLMWAFTYWNTIQSVFMVSIPVVHSVVAQQPLQGDRCVYVLWYHVNVLIVFTQVSPRRACEL